MDKLPIEITLDDSFYVAEEKSGYEVTLEAKVLWAVLLDLLVKFDSVCRRFNIKYSIDSGTFLGAVRHGGFIPWDNDVDVIMFRTEYERLCEIAPTAFKHPYFWQTNDTDPGSIRRHGQLRNSMTTCILRSEMEDGVPKYGYNQGAFLDVFILDEVPDDSNELITFQNELQQYMPLLWDFKEYYWLSGKSPWMKQAQQEAYGDFEKLITRYKGTGQKRVGNVALIPLRKERMLFNKELYEDLTEYQFEGFSFLGPRNYDTILTAHYGDWREFVIGNGDVHGELLWDERKSYTDYLPIERIDTWNKKSQNEQHPILKLYRHRDTLLMERDCAREEIKRFNERIQAMQMPNARRIKQWCHRLISKIFK